MLAYTNDSTDLALIVLSVKYHSPSGYKKVKGLLFNKKNGIVYENRKNYKLTKQFLKWNTIQEITCQLK